MELQENKIVLTSNIKFCQLEGIWAAKRESSALHSASL
jgi:hypothetical protein